MFGVRVLTTYAPCGNWQSDSSGNKEWLTCGGHRWHPAIQKIRGFSPKSYPGHRAPLQVKAKLALPRPSPVLEPPNDCFAMETTKSINS